MTSLSIALKSAGLLGLLAVLAAAPAIASASPVPPQKVSGAEISMLVRETILGLHQANLTANYSVLHDMGDSYFQATYSQSSLSDMFRGFRERRVNLAPAVLFDAMLSAPPKLTTDGLLHVAGYFPTTPQQIIFDLTFRNEGGLWRLDQINAGMRPVPLAAPVQPTATVQPTAQVMPVADNDPAPAPVPLAPRALRRPTTRAVAHTADPVTPTFE